MENVTLGQKRVQRNFNPTANKVVEDLKQKYADIIDFLETLRNKDNGREISIAQTECETSCMYAEKSQFVYAIEDKIPTIEEVVDKYVQEVKIMQSSDVEAFQSNIINPRIKGLMFNLFTDTSDDSLHYTFINEKGEQIRKMM